MKNKYKHISLTGPISDLDRVLLRYVARNNLVLQNSVKELHRVKGIKPLNDSTNIYEEALSKANYYAKILNIKPKDDSVFTTHEALKVVNTMNATVLEKTKQIEELETRRKKLLEFKNQVEPFAMIDFDLKTVFNFEYVKCSFGKMPNASYRQLKTYVHNKEDTLIVSGLKNNEFTWLVYFVPMSHSEKIDAVFKSLHFEKIYISDELAGNSYEALKSINEELDTLSAKIKDVEQQQSKMLEENKNDIAEAIARLIRLHEAYELRKNVAVTDTDYYILSGNIAVNLAEQFEAKIKTDDRVYLITLDEEDSETSIKRA